MTSSAAIPFPSNKCRARFHDTKFDAATQIHSDPLDHCSGLACLVLCWHASNWAADDDALNPHTETKKSSFGLEYAGCLAATGTSKYCVVASLHQCDFSKQSMRLQQRRQSQRSSDEGKLTRRETSIMKSEIMFPISQWLEKSHIMVRYKAR